MGDIGTRGMCPPITSHSNGPLPSDWLKEVKIVEISSFRCTHVRRTVMLQKDVRWPIAVRIRWERPPCTTQSPEKRGICKADKELGTM